MTRLAWFTALAILAAPAAAMAKPMPSPDEGPPAQPPRPPPPDWERPPPPAQPEPTPVFEREGWFAGFGLGAASVGYEDTDESYGAFVVDAHLGGMLTDRVGMLVWFSNDSHSLDDFNEQKASQTTFGAAGRYWITPRAWLGAGLGSSRWALREYDYDVADYDGRSFIVSGAYEVWQRKSMAIDIELRLTATTLDIQGNDASRASGGLAVHLTWY